MRPKAFIQALGPYALQAAIAACHAQARRLQDTDWHRIVALYDAHAQLHPSPIVELKRVVAVSMAFGPGAALELVDAPGRDPRLGRFGEARSEFSRAAGLAGNSRESELLLGRAAVCGAPAQ